nr:MAG TPA: hypothetical protein [Bacteriophage sp.]
MSLIRDKSIHACRQRREPKEAFNNFIKFCK